jgi:hypothetical protein
MTRYQAVAVGLVVAGLGTGGAVLATSGQSDTSTTGNTSGSGYSVTGQFAGNPLSTAWSKLSPHAIGMPGVDGASADPRRVVVSLTPTATRAQRQAVINWLRAVHYIGKVTVKKSH